MRALLLTLGVVLTIAASTTNYGNGLVEYFYWLGGWAVAWIQAGGLLIPNKGYQDYAEAWSELIIKEK